MPVFFTNYSRPPQVCEVNKEPSKTLQQFKDEADINHLIARYSKTGFYYDPLATVGQKRLPNFGDFSDFGDFAEQQERILRVYDAFAELPSSIREKFGHNPAIFVEFVGNPANEAECVKMGILTKAEASVVNSSVTEQVESAVEETAPVSAE